VSSRERRKRLAGKRGAPIKTSDAAKRGRPQVTPASAPAARPLSLPRNLEERLVDIEVRLDRLEAVPCVMACRGEACPTACPTGVTR
jgi:hypothetical protein